MRIILNLSDYVRRFIISGYYRCGNALLKILRWVLFRDTTDAKRILIFRTGSIGDNICAIPSIASIRKHFSGSEIHILTTAGTKSPISMARLLAQDCYDELIDYEGLSRRDLFSIVKRNEYDLVIELPQNMARISTLIRNMIFFRFAGVPSGWGWEVATLRIFRRAQERLILFSSERDRLLNILWNHGITIDGSIGYPLRIDPEDVNVVSRLMESKGLKSVAKKLLIAIVPGAKRPQNRYPIERYVELAKWLVDKNYVIVVIGGKDDVGRGIQLEAINGVYSFAGDLSPIQSAVLLSRCLITVSNDTGPMHLSYAVGTPVLAIFSSRDFPNKWFPPVGNQVLRNNHIHCSLCLSETCADNICMKGIPLEKVKAAFEELEKSTA